MASTPTVLPENPSFSDLKNALGGKPVEAVKTEPVKAEAVKTDEVKTEPVVTEPVKTDPVKTEPVVSEKKPKRFSELTRQIETERERARQLEAELIALRGKPTLPEPSKVLEATSNLPDKPKPPDAAEYKTWDELSTAQAKYVEDISAWSAKNAIHQEGIRRKQAEEKEQAQAVHQTWMEQLDAAVAENEYVADAVKKVGAVVGKLGIVDVIKESPVGVEIVMKLDADAEALAKLAKMSVASAAREIGKIESAIFAAKDKTPAKLPDPAPVVGGTVNNSTETKSKSLDQMSLAELREETSKGRRSRATLSVRRM
ncbi:MAG: hypothetical protein ACREHG_00915 [Candidatus Saccharimonadales bacterium]